MYQQQLYDAILKIAFLQVKTAKTHVLSMLDCANGNREDLNSHVVNKNRFSFPLDKTSIMYHNLS